MKNKDNKIIITDDDGKEHTMEILFTYDNKERDASYVFFYAPNDPENVIAMRYTKDGELIDITDDEEYKEVEEVFNAYMDDPKTQEAKA